MNENTFRSASWLRIFLGSLVIGFGLVLIAGYQNGGLMVRLALFGLLALSIGALLEIALSKIELRSDGLLLVTLFRKRFIARQEIESVTWETGCGVAVKLKNGKWAKLPDLGHNSQGIANSLRAWIKRTGEVHR